MMTHYFSCSRGPGVVSIKTSILRWDRYGFDRKRGETSYTDLLFLLPVASAGHVVHSIASEMRNINALF
jgi:hypothetical protein